MINRHEPMILSRSPDFIKVISRETNEHHRDQRTSLSRSITWRQKSSSLRPLLSLSLSLSRARARTSGIAASSREASVTDNRSASANREESDAFWRRGREIGGDQRSAELELSPGAEDQFPIIRGTRIYIRERGNKYGVYTAVHLHDRVVRRGAMRRERDKFLASGQYFGFPKPFRPIQMDATDKPGTAKLRNYGTKWTRTLPSLPPMAGWERTRTRGRTRRQRRRRRRRRRRLMNSPHRYARSCSGSFVCANEHSLRSCDHVGDMSAFDRPESRLERI